MNRGKMAYQNVNFDQNTKQYSQYELFQLSLQGLIDKISLAKKVIDSINQKGKEPELVAQKTQLLLTSMDLLIVWGGILDLENGGEAALNLDLLFEYIHLSLFDANRNNDSSQLEAVCDLVRTIKEGWDQLPS